MGKFGNTHEEYINRDGVEVPSVTTILKLLNKPTLQKWANYLGFKRQDVTKVLEESAHIGTNTHNAISAYFLEEKFTPDLKYPNELENIRANLNSFFEWINNYKVEVSLSEAKFIGKKYGGTVDFYGQVDNKTTIVDFKTSKDFYPSMFLQLGAYTNLIEDSGRCVEQVGILLVNSKKMEFKTLSREEINPFIEVYNELADVYHKIYNLDQISKQHKIKPIIET